MNSLVSLGSTPWPRFRQSLRGILDTSTLGHVTSSGLRVAATGAIATPACNVWPAGRFALVATRLTPESSSGNVEPPPLDVWHKAWLQTLASLAGSASQVTAEATNPLGLSNGSISHSRAKTKARRGTGGITRHGQRMIESGCFLLEERYGKDRLSFLTLTLPELSEDDRVAVIENWSEVCRVFFQRLTRALQRAGLRGSYCQVTEIQGERYDRTGRAFPHIHAVFCGGHRPGKWVLKPHHFRQMWQEAVMIHCTGLYDWSASENVQAVEKSAAQYLSKYLSKGLPEGVLEREGSDAPCPSAWYGMSDLLRGAIKRRILSGESVTAILSMAIDHYVRTGEIDAAIKWIRPVMVPVRGSMRQIGWCGALTRKGMIELRADLDSLREANARIPSWGDTYSNPTKTA